ncbi:MAG: GIY-YIG nuclease family protein [Deltaproteobacteria bacterium]|nr:GIY-YIG nuclease family protein [Deltaproteobacteria bacterium]
MKNGYVYILTNKFNRVLYIGVTSNLSRRMEEHKLKLVEGFTKKYNLSKLVYFEELPSIIEAIEAEKKIKAGSRKKKLELIKKVNPQWTDLSQSL